MLCRQSTLSTTASIPHSFVFLLRYVRRVSNKTSLFLARPGFSYLPSVQMFEACTLKRRAGRNRRAVPTRVAKNAWRALVACILGAKWHLKRRKGGELKAAALQRAGSVSWNFQTIKSRSIFDYHFRISKIETSRTVELFRKDRQVLTPTWTLALYNGLPTTTIATDWTLVQSEDQGLDSTTGKQETLCQGAHTRFRNRQIHCPLLLFATLLIGRL